MWRWLMSLVRRRPTYIVRSMEEGLKLVRERKIKPHVYRDGDVQVVEMFAEAMLKQPDFDKAHLRSGGVPPGIRMYVHKACAERYRQKVVAEGRVIFARDTEELAPEVLIGRYRDVTHCDECGQEFQPTDEGYWAYWIISPEWQRLWDEVQAEPRPTQAP